MNAELAEVRDFVAGIPPFDTLPARLLDELPAMLEVRYFRRGTRILSVGQDNDTMFILRAGAVDLHHENGDFLDRRGTGAAFGMSTLIRTGPFMAQVTAIEDTLVLAMPRAVFDGLAREQPQFVAYYRLRLAERMRAAVAAVHGSGRGEPILKTRASDLLRRGPVSATLDATIHEASRMMRDKRTSS
ncbi:MAG TPA: cyclic nucleotide-binding domain-containing protein, partial [Candidatus Lustribacter sp.]|nr:cyclic nucleotide-binding domain-containing protein [Candidatus Lustribacter sp.]